jgi:hypothetical protein
LRTASAVFEQAVRRSLHDERMLSSYATMLRYCSFARTSVGTYTNNEDWQHEDQVDGL